MSIEFKFPKYHRSGFYHLAFEQSFLGFCLQVDILNPGKIINREIKADAYTKELNRIFPAFVALHRNETDEQLEKIRLRAMATILPNVSTRLDEYWQAFTRDHPIDPTEGDPKYDHHDGEAEYTTESELAALEALTGTISTNGTKYPEEEEDDDEGSAGPPSEEEQRQLEEQQRLFGESAARLRSAQALTGAMTGLGLGRKRKAEDEDGDDEMEGMREVTRVRRC